jgi:hypothetical protein
MLTASNLLDVWERGLTHRTTQRSIDLLCLAYPELSREQLNQLPIGDRDARLLSIREALFGPRLSCITSCPKCGEQLELTFGIAEIRVAAPELSLTETYVLSTDGYDVQFRLPNSLDVLSILELSDVSQARRRLFERCVHGANRDGQEIAVQELSEEVANQIALCMTELDPQADIQIALNCPACSENWTSMFDISTYLWTEINAWAIRMLGEIHRLASTYGWREAEILALSPIRRQLYLELIGSR